MKKYPFAHDGPVYVTSDGVYKTAYYSRERAKYKRVLFIEAQEWSDTIEKRVDDDVFWMVVACIERRKRHASQQT